MIFFIWQLAIDNFYARYYNGSMNRTNLLIVVFVILAIILILALIHVSGVYDIFFWARSSVVAPSLNTVANPLTSVPSFDILA